MVALMMFSGVAVMVDAGDNDATAWTPNGTGNSYTYVLHYDSSEMGNTAAQELQLSVAGTTPISHTAGTTTLSSVANEGSWGFDTTTGIGPFNSFYAAFDINNNNAFVSILNPYNLTQKIDGTSLGTASDYNIMWVLPTVYWYVDQNGDVTLTNDPSSDGTAYAHTIDGIVYDYVAYGVYEGSEKTVNNKATFTSISGVAPTTSQARSTLRSYSNNNSLSALGEDAKGMLWNFYQWELYKLCGYVVMEGFNSQAIVGNGNVYGSNLTMHSGLLDTYGPYVGNPGNMGGDGSSASLYGTDGVKLFIENAWGSIGDMVDGVIESTNSHIYLDSSSQPTDSTTPGGYITDVQVTIATTNWGSAITTNELIWGMPTSSQSSNSYYNIGTTDKINAGTVGNKICNAGGWSNSSASSSSGYGLSFVNMDMTTTANYNDMGSRLAFVYNSQMVTASFAANDDNYGSVTDASIADIEPGTTATISGNTITIGETTVTATPAIADAQYTYAFSKWQVSGVDATGTYTLNADTTFTAVFTATTNQYAVTIAPNDPSYGSVSPSSLTVDYGTSITVDGTNLTIGSQAITATASDATAQYTYAFSSWTVPDAAETVTGAITITGTFTATVNTYTVTIESADVSLGTVDVSEVQDVLYGTAITVSGDTITIGETTVTATPSTGLVTKWSVSDGTTVQGDLTITASFVQPANVENTLIQLIPFLLIMVLVVTAAAGVFSAGGDPENLIRLVIGLAVAVLIIAVFVLPTVGGM